MALKLGATFGTTPDFWLNAQKAVDIYRALHDGLDLPPGRVNVRETTGFRVYCSASTRSVRQMAGPPRSGVGARIPRPRCATIDLLAIVATAGE